MKKSRILALVVVLFFSLALKPAFAAADQYDDSQSNAFRVLGYLMYPAAFVAEWTIFRPFHWLVSATPAQEAFFGHVPHPPVLTEPLPYTDYGVPSRMAPGEARASTPPVAAAAQENEKILRVPLQNTVIKPIPQII